MLHYHVASLPHSRWMRHSHCSAGPPSLPTVDRIYAQHVVQQAGDGGGDSGILSQLSEADRRGMQR